MLPHEQSRANDVFVKSARFYDALYGFKNYAAACDRLHALIQSLRPGATSLLDVACGTGKHLEHLRYTYAVEGLDLSQELLDIARERCPGVTLHQADMTDFSLPRKFDVVTCLFSSIGYVGTEARLRTAMAAMARHLNPDGVLVVEPWFSPEQFITGRVTTNFVDEPDLKVAWMYTSQAIDNLSVMDIHYLVGTPAGVEHFVERHEVGLFSDAQYRSAMEAAGLKVDHDNEGLFGRGMYTGRTGTGEAAPAASVPRPGD